MNRFQEAIQLQLSCPLCHTPLEAPNRGHNIRHADKTYKHKPYKYNYDYKYWVCNNCEITIMIRGKPE